MTHVVVTVKNPDGQRADLALPMEIPCNVLANAVAEAMGLTVHTRQSYYLVHRSGKSGKKLTAEQTLQTANVMFGDMLDLAVGEVSLPVAESTAAAAELVGPNNTVFPLQGVTIMLGRRTPNNPVDIDLTPFDPERLASRRHASIEKQKGHYMLLDENSANGTWLNGNRITPGKAQILPDGAEIVFGGPGGPTLKFIHKSKPNTPGE